MIGKLKKLFSSEDGEVDLSRRKFIKTASALAALTVIATQLPVSSLKIREIEEQIASGSVVDQIFYLTEPVVIDIPNVVIDRCEFIAVEEMDCMILINAKNCTIQNSTFTTNGLVGVAINITPTPIDWVENLKPVFKASDLTEGAYYTAKA